MSFLQPLNLSFVKLCVETMQRSWFGLDYFVGPDAVVAWMASMASMVASTAPMASMVLGFDGFDGLDGFGGTRAQCWNPAVEFAISCHTKGE